MLENKFRITYSGALELQTRFLSKFKYRERQEIAANMLMHLKKPIIKITATIKHLKVGRGLQLLITGRYCQSWPEAKFRWLWTTTPVKPLFFLVIFDFTHDLLYNYIAFRAIFLFDWYLHSYNKTITQ